MSVFYEYLCVCYLSHNLTGSEYLWYHRREWTQRVTLSRPPPPQDHLRKTRAYIWLIIIFQFQRAERSIQARISYLAAFPATADNQNRTTNMHGVVRPTRLLFWFIIVIFFLTNIKYTFARRHLLLLLLMIFCAWWQTNFWCIYRHQLDRSVEH